MDELKEELNKDRFRVAIFGSARLKEDSPEYYQVFNLARLIASAEIDLVTGGGPGLMEAASKGFHEGKENVALRSIGLNIKLPDKQRFAAHLDVKNEFDLFSERLDSFADLDLIYLTKDCVETFAVLQESYNDFRSGGTQFCRTYKKFRPNSHTAQ